MRRSGRYEVKNWTFITPRKLSSDVIGVLRKRAGEYGIEGNHQEATYLATVLGKHSYLLQQFPDLLALNIDQKLDQIMEYLMEYFKRRPPIQEPTTEQIDKGHVYRAEPKRKDELDRVISLRENPPTENTKAALKTIYYASTDHIVKINALLGLLDLYDPQEDTADDMVTMCEDGIMTSRLANADSARAYFSALKGYFVSYIYSNSDAQTACQINIDNVMGSPAITEQYRQAVINRLAELERSYSSAFDEAIETAKQTHDLALLASVLIPLGTAAGRRALYLNKLDVRDRAAAEQQRCKRALLIAKEIYGYLQDDLGKAQVLLSLANQIRLFGETKEAAALVEGAIAVAEECGDHRLLKKAKGLKETPETE